MNSLAIQRYQFNCQTRAELKLNNYSGSLLRGALGHALRELACVTKMQHCPPCLLYRQCSYPTIFEPPPPTKAVFHKLNHMPAPYVIEPPAMGQVKLTKGASFSFNMVLMGAAIKQLPLVIVAWEKALAKGLGKDYCKVQLQQIIYEPQQSVEQLIYQRGKSDIAIQESFQPLPIEPAEQMYIQFVTPLRILQNKQLLNNGMLAKDFLMALARRYYLLQEFYAEDYQAPDFRTLARLAAQIQAQPEFKRYSWSRYSTRQQQKIEIRGVIGLITLKGDLTPFLNMLNIGQWLHIGKNTTFGMGQYVILPNTQ